MQHHPARAHLLGPLLERLDGLVVDVVTDPLPDDSLPNPLRTYTLTLDQTPAWATHRLVMQDDAWPCREFATRLMDALSERPDEMVALFAPGCAPHRAIMLSAQKRGERWARLHSLWMPTVAMCWPAEYAADFVGYADAELGVKLPGVPFRGDDGPVGRFCQARHLNVWATVPSLVEHPDVERSLIGRPNRSGKNRARVAALFDE